MQSKLSASFDPTINVVHLTGAGMWSLEELHNYEAVILATLDKARRGSEGARILADYTGATVQAPEVIEEISAFMGHGYRANDRLAIIVGSSRGKMEMRRVNCSAIVDVFLSRMAAMAWLLAADQSASKYARQRGLIPG